MMMALNQWCFAGRGDGDFTYLIRNYFWTYFKRHPLENGGRDEGALSELHKAEWFQAKARQAGVERRKTVQTAAILAPRKTHGYPSTKRPECPEWKKAEV